MKVTKEEIIEMVERLKSVEDVIINKEDIMFKELNNLKLRTNYDLDDYIISSTDFNITLILNETYNKHSNDVLKGKITFKELNNKLLESVSDLEYKETKEFIKEISNEIYGKIYRDTKIKKTFYISFLKDNFKERLKENEDEVLILNDLYDKYYEELTFGLDRGYLLKYVLDFVEYNINKVIELSEEEKLENIKEFLILVYNTDEDFRNVRLVSKGLYRELYLLLDKEYKEGRLNEIENEIRKTIINLYLDSVDYNKNHLFNDKVKREFREITITEEYVDEREITREIINNSETLKDFIMSENITIIERLFYDKLGLFFDYDRDNKFYLAREETINYLVKELKVFIYKESYVELNDYLSNGILNKYKKESLNDTNYTIEELFNII